MILRISFAMVVLRESFRLVLMPLFAYNLFYLTVRLRSGGLGGNVWNIVLQPLGTIVLVSTLAACQHK